MKKFIALLLVLVMAFSLVACGGTAEKPAEDNTPAPQPDTADTTPAAPADDGEVKKPESAVVDTTTVTDFTGYPEDTVDNFARDPYKFAFMANSYTSITATFYNAMVDFQDRLNFTIDKFVADGDNDLFINTMQTYALQGYNGFLLNPDTNVLDRVVECAEEELDIPFILVFNGRFDEEGHSLEPCVNLFAEDLGYDCMNWMLDNYKDYIGDIDLKAEKVGYAFVTQSAIPDLVNRTYTAIDVLKSRMGEDVEYYIADCITTAVSEQGAYEALAPLLAAHPEFEYWVIFADMPDFANGSARAIEDAGHDEKTILVCGGETLLIQVWEESDYEGCWVGAYAINNYLYVWPMLSGLIALADGRADHDTLWADSRREGDLATLYSLPTVMFTKDNYKDILHGVEDQLGFQIQWY
ncbi:MAG: hypothetical protein HUJ65_04190 [Oscillospiraceae bacterium]|nr:hypothetical protein [Oscillospiraceae bacterium]